MAMTDNDGPHTDDNFEASPALLSPNEVGVAEYGGEVSPKGPRQDMFVGDVLAGGPVEDRTAAASAFTGGDQEKGAGGMAIGQEPGDETSAAGTTVQRGARIGL